MNRWTKFIGIIGAVFVLFVLISIPFFSIFAGGGVDLVKQFLPLANLTLGGLFCVIWLALSFSQGNFSAMNTGSALTGRRARYGFAGPMQ